MVVAGVDQSFFDVALIDGDDHRWLSWDIDHTIVVGRSLGGCAATEEGDRSGDGIRDEGADVFQDRHGLLAIDDVLDGGNLSVLAGAHVAEDISVGSEDISDGPSRAVVGGECEDITLAGISQVLSQPLRAPARIPRTKYLPRSRKKNNGIATVMSAAAICRLYNTNVVPCAEAMTTWTVWVS